MNAPKSTPLKNPFTMPITALPPPHTNWQTKEHFLKTIGGFLEAAEMHLPLETYHAVLEAVQDDILRRCAQVAAALPPQTAQDLHSAAVRVLKAPHVLVTWTGLGPVVTRL
jgi:hypothetical protein